LKERELLVNAETIHMDFKFPSTRRIKTWELLRFHSKLEKSSDEVEDVKDDRPRIRAIDLLASRLTL
jgi:hypothetical protein